MDDSHRSRLAEGPVCMVEECSCGVLHLSIGPVTLRLQSDAVESMWATLGEALRRRAACEREPDARVLAGSWQDPRSGERLS